MDLEEESTNTHSAEAMQGAEASQGAKPIAEEALASGAPPVAIVAPTLCAEAPSPGQGVRMPPASDFWVPSPPIFSQNLASCIIAPRSHPLPFSPIERLRQHYKLTQLPRGMNINSAIATETRNLYKMHLRQEISYNGIVVPKILPLGYQNPPRMQALLKYVARFRNSQQRLWIYKKASEVNLESLNVHSFRILLGSLFKKGGVTWERVLVLFFFCSDLTVHALREHTRNYFYRIYNWTLCYLNFVFSCWVERNGGWEVILNWPFESDSNKTSVVFMIVTCLSFVALCTFFQKIDS